MSAPLNIAQITDSHLFSDINARHYGSDVYQNLNVVLADIKQKNVADIIIFTGDLTQDHSEKSYQNFVDCVLLNNITQPVYFLAGNHDDPKFFTHYLNTSPFTSEKTIEHEHWQIILLHTKGESPAGFISPTQLAFLEQAIDENKSQLIFMHHHPMDVGYFIDRHGLTNKQALWNVVDNHPSIKAMACGHVHQGLTLLPEESGFSKTLYTCPATSIQFERNHEGVVNNGQGPGYRTFILSVQGQLKTHLHFVN